MDWEVFCQKVRARVDMSGTGMNVRFYNDLERGRFLARCQDGTTIIGNPSSLKVTVRFGSGHQAMAEI